ncbi:Cbp/p300-interacting transactivator 4 [Tupaia chinensis]|uniref:Cbp/p300-interacting transactivator 4 n=1 Tax=Tupaia chinensis TaxID=246437 RepID=L8Y7G6_TUPCH|nr:Cbp/p300-interacting transactivator 4 [Tupaia chinensis]
MPAREKPRMYLPTEQLAPTAWCRGRRLPCPPTALKHSGLCSRTRAWDRAWTAGCGRGGLRWDRYHPHQGPWPTGPSDHHPPFSPFRRCPRRPPAEHPAHALGGMDAELIDEEALTSLELELGLHRVRELPELFLGQSEFDCFSDLGSAPPAGSVSC